MTITLELTPEIEAGLSAQAQARGLSLQAYLEHVLHERSSAIGTLQGEAKEKARAFEAWARSHPHTPPLSDDSIRRENLTRDVR